MSTYRDRFSDRKDHRDRNYVIEKHIHNNKPRSQKHYSHHGYPSDDEGGGSLTPQDPDKLTPDERRKLLEKRIKQLEENEKKILELQLKDRYSQQESRYSERSRDTHSHVTNGEAVKYYSGKSHTWSRISSPPTFRSNISNEIKSLFSDKDTKHKNKNSKYKDQNRYLFEGTEIYSSPNSNAFSKTSPEKYSYSGNNYHSSENFKYSKHTKPPRSVQTANTDTEMKEYEAVRRISRDYRANILTKAEQMIQDRKRKESDGQARVQEYVDEHQKMFLKQQEKTARQHKTFVSKRPRSPPSDSEYIEVPENADSDSEIPKEFRIRTKAGNRWYSRDIPSAIRSL